MKFCFNALKKAFLLTALSTTLSTGYSTGTLSQEETQLCNKTGEQLNVSWGYASGVSRGWFRLNNERCITPIAHAVHGLPTHYYAVSVAPSDRYAWNGDESKSYCIPNRTSNSNQIFELQFNEGCSEATVSRQYGLLEDGKTLSSAR